jgi:hypothetical protein
MKQGQVQVESRVLMMVYNTQTYWVSALCPEFQILENNVLETGCFRPQVRGGDDYSVVSLRNS